MFLKLLQVRWKTNRAVCRYGPDRWGFLKAWYLSRLKLRLPWLVPFEFIFKSKIDGTLLKLVLRYNSTDASVLRGIFEHQSYNVEKYGLKVNRCIDLGGNIGLGVAYLKARYPEMDAVIVEPDPGNLVQLKKTLVLNDWSFRVYAGAIGPESGVMSFDINDGAPSCSRLRVDGNINWNVPVLTIRQILAKEGWDTVDLIKMDIEGGEEAMILKGMDELKRARYILFELHGWVSGEELFKKLQQANFEIEAVSKQGDETYLAKNLDLK